MSNNTINAGFRAMGFAADEVVMHGYRATARTMLHERLGFSPDVIEAQLAHSVRDNLGRAYNRTEFIEQRRVMLQRWADYLDELRLSGDTAKPVDETSGDRVDAKDLLTPQAAADLVNVSRPFVVRHIDSGDIPVVMVGSRQRVRKQDVLAWHERVQDKSARAHFKLLDAVDDELRG